LFIELALILTMTKLITLTTIAILVITFFIANHVSSKEITVVYNSLKGLVVKEDVQRLNHKKSGDLTSIKAYRKSLQIKVKTSLPC